ncbi:MAG: hypothetical protein K6G31_13140 [Paludibacteraceae bacterium]|nr:hypothetical protein [Paludibacteraceae bacterium]
MKRLFTILFVLVAVFSARAAVTFTMEPECVSRNNGSAVTFNNIVIKMKNAQPNTEYRLNGCSGTFSLTPDVAGSVNYTATNVRIYVNADTQHNPFCTFRVEKRLNGRWVDAGISYNVPYCWVDCPTDLSEKYLFTTSNECTINNEQDFLTQENAHLPTANFQQSYKYDWGSGYQGFKTLEDDKTYKGVKVRVYTPSGHIAKQCTLPNYWVRSCPRYTPVTFTLAANQCVLPSSTINNKFSSYATDVKPCPNASTLSLSYNRVNSSYPVGTYTLPLYHVPSIFFWTGGYDCPQTFTVKARAVTCSMDNRNNKTEQITTCGKEYELSAPTVPCSEKRYYSIDGGDFIEVPSNNFRESFYVRDTPYEITWKVSDGVTTAVCATKSVINVSLKQMSATCGDYGYVAASGPFLLKYPSVADATEVNFEVTSLKHDGSNLTWEVGTDGINAELPMGSSEIKMNAYNCGDLQAELTCPVLVVQKADVCE